jgi:predicted metal-dependent hydrolase
MPLLQYGRTTIEWRFQPDATLKRHYLTVERGQAVLLRGPLVDEIEQEALVRQRARWIREKLSQVNLPQAVEPIVTGSRLRYCGRSYFTEVKHALDLVRPQLTFTASRFIVENPAGLSIEPDILAPLLDGFYRERAHEKLLVRVRHWERQTGCKLMAHAFGIFRAAGPAATRKTYWSLIHV